MAEDEKRRARNNLAVSIAVAVIVVLGILLVLKMAQALKLANCVAAGHRDCEPVAAAPEQP